MLEDRTTPATFAEFGAGLNLSLLANEQATITAAGGQYSMVLAGGVWTGTDSANATGNGSNTLTVTAAGLAAFTDINISDAGAGTAVQFGGGTNTFSDNFSVILDDGALLPVSVQFRGLVDFAGTASLFVNTDSGILVASDGGFTAFDGDVTLQGNPTGARTTAFVGVQVDGAVSTSGVGNIILLGQGGDQAGADFNHGVLINGFVSTTGGGGINVQGTGGTGALFNDGVRVNLVGPGIASAVGHIVIGGTAGSNGIGINLTNGGAVRITNAANIFLTADSMQLENGAIDALLNDVVIATETPATAIDLGGADAAGTLGLFDAEFDAIGASRIFVGNALQTGGVASTAVVSPALAQALIVTTGAAISDANAAAVNFIVAILVLNAETGVGTPGDPLEIDATLFEVHNGLNGGIGPVSVVDVAGGVTVVNGTNIGGDIRIETIGGDLAIDFMNANADDISLASATAIVGNPFHLMIASGIQLSAATGIGTVGQSMVAFAGTISADCTAGGIYLDNNGALIVGAVDVFGVVQVGVNGGGDVVITANSPLTVSSPINAVGNITLTAGELNDPNVWADDLTIQAAVGSTGGNVVLRAGDDVIFGGILPTANGTVSAEAGFNDLDNRGAVVVNGTAGNDLLVLSVSAALETQFQLNGSAPVVLVNLDQFGFSGSDGNDRLVVDFTNGSPLPANGVGYDGGNQTGAPGDLLSIIGNGLQDVVYSPDGIAPGSGVLDVDMGVIAFRNLEPVEVFNVAIVTLFLPNDQDLVDMDEVLADFDNNPVTPDDAGLIFRGTSGGVAFESLAVRGCGLITVDTSLVDDAGLPDTITLLAGANDHQNISLGIFTGDFGEDQVIVAGEVVFDVGPAFASTIQIVSNGTIVFNAPLRAGNELDAMGAVVTRGYIDLTARTALAGVTGIVGAGNAGLADIFADDVSLWANNDIGDFGNGRPVRVEAFDLANSTSINLEARSNFGGIYLAAAGDMEVGGVDFGFNLDLVGITAFGGILDFFIFGSLNVSRSQETIFAATDMVIAAESLPAFNLIGEIFTGGQAGDRTLPGTLAAIQSDGVGANVLIRADRDVLLGNGLGWGDVRNANGATTTILADFDGDLVGDVFVSNDTLVRVGGTLAIGGQNVFVDNDGLTTFSALQTNGGLLTLTSGAGGIVSILVGIDNALLNVFASVDTTMGGLAAGADIVIVADDVELVAGGVGTLALDAGTGIVHVFLVTIANEIELGATVDLNRLNLDNAELQLVAASAVRIGGDPADVANNPPVNTGDILITELIVAPATWNTLALRTAGQIVEDVAGGLTVENVALVGLAGVNLCDGVNDIVVLAGAVATGSDFRVANARAGNVIVGQVDGVFGIAAIDGNITLFAPAARLSIEQPIDAGGAGVVRLTANQGIVQNALGFIVAERLGARNDGANAAGDIELVAGENQLFIFAAVNEAPGGKVVLLSKTFAAANHILSVDIVVDDGACFALAAGVTTNNGDFTIIATNGNTTDGQLAFDEFVDLGTGVARLYAVAGIVDTGGGFTASALSALNGGDTGVIELDGLNLVGTVAAYNQALGGGVGIVNQGTLVVGQVTSDGILPELNGIAAQNADVIVELTAGALDVQQAITVGNAAVVLLAFDGISQGVDGFIIARSLAAENATAGDIVLDNQDNFVNVFAAATLTPGAAQNIVFRNSIGFIVDEVNAAPIGDASIANFETAAGFAAPDDNVTGIETDGGTVDLSTAGALELGAPVAAGVGSVLLTAGEGVFQLPGGVIDAAALGVENTISGDVRLTQTNRIDGVVALANRAVGGGVFLVNDFDLEIGAVAAGALFVGVDGISTNDGTVVVATDGVIDVQAPIDAGAARVLLHATEGMTQGVAGTITATDLSAANVDGAVAATGNIVLDAANAVGLLAAANNAAGAAIVFNNTITLTVGIVDSIQGLIAGAVGVFASGGDVVLATGGELKLANAIVSENAAGDVLLQAKSGVTQDAAGPIEANRLGVENTDAGNIELTAANNILIFAAINDAPDGTVQLANFNDLTIGSVTAQAPIAGDLVGVRTAGGDVALSISGRMEISEALTAGGAKTVRLHVQEGVSQTATGIITAGLLGVENVGGGAATGAIELLAVNAAARVALVNEAAGERVSFRNGVATAVDSVALLTGLFGGATGVASNNGDVALLSNDSLELSKLVAAGTGTVRLFSTKGTTQATDGMILAGKLAAINQAGAAAAAGNIALSAANAVDSFTAYNAADGGTVTLVNSKGLLVDHTFGLPGVFEQTAGIFANSTAEGAITLTVPGVLTLKAFLIGKATLHGGNTGGLSLQHPGSFERVDHVLSGAGAGSVEWAAQGLPIMKLTYDGLANPGPIDDQLNAVARSFHIAVANKTTDVAPVTGSTTFTKINTTDNSTMRIDFRNPISTGGGSLQIRIDSTLGANGDTVDPANLSGSANAAIEFRNLAGKVNIPVGAANPLVAVRLVGGSGIDRFGFSGDAAIAWTVSQLFAIDGAASNNDILDVFFSDPAVAVDLALHVASNVNHSGDLGVVNVERVLNK